MPTRQWRGAVLGGVIALAACYHQVVETGLSAGTTKIARPWTATWIWGLVPATPIDVRRECTSGVAHVDTQIPFVNGLVSFITFGIYTPLSVTVTCASGSASIRSLRIDVVQSDVNALGAALRQAERLSAESGQGVYVVFPSVLIDSTSDGGTDR